MDQELGLPFTCPLSQLPFPAVGLREPLWVPVEGGMESPGERICYAVQNYVTAAGWVMILLEHAPFLNLRMWSYLEEDFCNEVQDLEVRSTWIRMNPKPKFLIREEGG